jgi:hypothetical protein
MKEIVTKYVKGCVMCSTCKPTNRKLGLYSPMFVPSHPWESISMDFVGGLPMSKRGHDYLYVVVDRFINMFILMPFKNNITTEQTVNIFFQYVWVHFGLPTSIISNRDTRFLGDFWTSLWRMMDTKLKRRISFHPQNNGHRLLNKLWYFFFKAIATSIPSYGMNRYPMYNMCTNEPYIPPLSVRLLRHVLGIYLKFLWT